jgi:Tol biopolymer transport system component
MISNERASPTHLTRNTTLTPLNDISRGAERTSGDGAPPVEHALMEAQLERIFAHGEFSRSEHVKRMLRYVVQRSLSPGQDGLKERRIAEEVFDRGADWDPKIDPVVRLTAMRLRTKLETYYASVGKDDRVIISVPKGQYAAVIEVRPAAGEIPAASPARKRLATSTAVSVAAAACLLLAWIVRPRADATSTLPPSVTPVSTEIGRQFSPALSPDGRSVAYVWDGDGRNFDIYVKRLESGAVRRLTVGIEPDLNPAWSPDGKWIAFLRVLGRSVAAIVVPAEGTGPERVLATFTCEFGNWTGDDSSLLGNPGPEWSADGRKILLSEVRSGGNRHSIFEIPLESGKPQALTETSGEVRDFYPRVSPDGRRLAFVRYASHGIGELFVANADGSNPVALTANHRTIQGIAWSPDSRSIVFSSNRNGRIQLWERAVDGGSLRSIDVNSTSAAQPAIRGNDLVFVETLENWNIWQARILHGKAEDPVRLISSTGRNYDPRVSPDGSTIAFVSDRAGTWQIWLCDRRGEHLRQLTRFNTAWMGSPGWSPDGKRIAFDARPDGHSGIYAADAASGDVTVIEKSAAEERSPSWSRDGHSIYFNSNRDGRTAIYKKDLETGRVAPVAGNDVFASAESFDGKILYFSSSSTGEIWRSGVDGADPVRIVSAPRPFPPMGWTVFAGGLYFSSNEDNSDRYLLSSFIDGRLTEIGHTKMPVVAHTPSLGASPDGKYLLFAQEDQSRSNITMSHGIRF